MGVSKHQFRLYEGAWNKKTTWDQVRKYKSIEMGVVSYSDIGLSIGNLNIPYADLDRLSLEIFSGYDTNFIQMKNKSGKEFVLFPIQKGTDNCDAVSLKSEELFLLIKAPWERSQQEFQTKAKVQLQQALEAGSIEKIRKMIAVSTKIKLDMMRQLLGFDEATFNNKIFDWAIEFGFKIDGDFIVIEGGDVSSFISNLDKEFTAWDSNVEKKTGKI